MTTLRVATLNLWGTNRPWRHRLGLIRQELDVLQSDVVALQEVMRQHGRCQAAEVADGLGYEVAYAAACEQPDGRVQGNALLSRLPIREQRWFELPVGDAEPRVLLFALVQTDDGRLPVFTTHLNWQPDHGAVRVEQVRFIAARVAELALDQGQDRDALPAVVLGDLNAEPGSDELRYLCGAGTDGTSPRFADAGPSGGDGSTGATFDKTNDYAALTEEPSRRIDYILTGGVALHRGTPVRTALAFAEADTSGGNRVWPSDHFGVVSDIVLSPRG